MTKKSFLIIIFYCSTAIYSQSLAYNSFQNNEMITKYQKLPPQQLLDTANYYYNNSLFDKALVCYSLLINTYSKDVDFEQQYLLIEAMNKSAHIYYFMCDYRQAYGFLIKALLLCENTNNQSYESKIYNNIGNIYYRFNNFDIAKLYYTKALDLCTDSAVLVILYNNLGSIELENERIVTSFYYLNKALQICKRHTDIYSHELLRNKALCYQKIMRYDSAYYYHHLSLDELRKIKISGKECEAENLSNLGQMFFALNKTDSALFYLGLSNKIAQENHFLRILSDNYLAISKNEEEKGNIKNAFEHYKIYAGLKDSIFNNDIFGDINQLQRIYEVSKTNQQIEQLVVEKQIKERTIHYQKTIWIITLCVLLLVSSGLLYIYIQKRNLNRAYKLLFEKNVEIVELQKREPEKYVKHALPYNIQDELLHKILNIMEDASIVCNTDFSLDKLAELLDTNHVYVSQIINNALKKNFRSFLNSYRIREAQQLLASNVAQKYTIETIALQVGFKSQTAFREAFKELTGVNPHFYLKSIQQDFNG